MQNFDKNRRVLLRAGLVPLAGLALPNITAQAQTDYPSRGIKIVIGFPPGTSTDTWARLTALRLSAALKQPVHVDNKPGAHGQLGCVTVKNSEKDGYTLLYASLGTAAINPSLYGKRLQYDTMKDFDPIVGVEKSTIYLGVAKNIPVTNVQEMIAYVKANPGRVNYGSAGAGTTSHLAMEMLKKATGMQMTHVPYRGMANVIQDMLGGNLQFAFDAAAAMVPQWTAGNLRLIGVASSKRMSIAPDIPTIEEQGVPNFEVRLWSGLFAPAGTPASVIAKLNKAVNDELRAGTFGDTMRSVGAEPFGGTSNDFRKFVGSEIAFWAPVIKNSGAVAD